MQYGRAHYDFFSPFRPHMENINGLRERNDALAFCMPAILIHKLVLFLADFPLEYLQNATRKVGLIAFLCEFL